MTRTATRTTCAVALLLLLAAAIAGCTQLRQASRSDAARAQPGSCLEVTDDAQSRSRPVDCGSSHAVYTVMSAAEHKVDCGAEYSSYEETFEGGTTAFLCLAPNLAQDSCYRRDNQSGFFYTDCASPDSTVKVVRRIDGQADPALCDPSTTVLAVSRPEVTFCLVNPRD